MAVAESRTGWVHGEVWAGGTMPAALEPGVELQGGVGI